MMSFTRFYEHFLFCSAFFAEMKKYPEQERGLLLIGATIRKFDAETRLVAMNDGKGNIVIVVARHRPPFWNANYTNALSDALFDGDIMAAGAKIYRSWGLRLRLELSQSARGPAHFMYPDDHVPAVARFVPNWERIYETITEMGYTVQQIIPNGVCIGSGYVLMNDGMCIALKRGCYKLPEEDLRSNATPDAVDGHDITPLLQVAKDRA